MSKRGLLAFITVMLLVLCSAFAVWACERNITLGNTKAPGTFFYGWSDIAGVGGVFWVPGAGNSMPGKGKDSGRYVAAGDKANSDWTNQGTEGGKPVLVIAGTWAANRANPADECPDPATDPVTVALWEQTGEGTPGHAGRFVCATTRFSQATTRYNFSSPMSPADAKQFQPIPVPIIEELSGSTVRVSWVLPSAGVSQYFDKTLSAPAVISGWEVCYAKGAVPTTGDAKVWKVKSTVAGGATSATLSFQPGEWSPGEPLFVAVRPVFDNTFRPPFVGGHAAVTGKGGKAPAPKN